MADNKTRRSNYRKLRNAGYTPKEANALKNNSPKRVSELIRMKKNEIRRANYKKLRAVGYTPKEADRFKGSNPAKIEQLVHAKRLENRRTTYKRLRKAGYSREEARRWDEANPARVDELIKAKRRIEILRDKYDQFIEDHPDLKDFYNCIYEEDMRAAVKHYLDDVKSDVDHPEISVLNILIGWLEKKKISMREECTNFDKRFDDLLDSYGYIA